MDVKQISYTSLSLDFQTGCKGFHGGYKSSGIAITAQTAQTAFGTTHCVRESWAGGIMGGISKDESAAPSNAECEDQEFRPGGYKRNLMCVEVVSTNSLLFGTQLGL
jgi:hypothetical protein